MRTWDEIQPEFNNLCERMRFGYPGRFLMSSKELDLLDEVNARMLRDMGTFIERSTALEMIALAMDPAGHPELVGNQHWVERRRKGTAVPYKAGFAALSPKAGRKNTLQIEFLDGETMYVTPASYGKMWRIWSGAPSNKKMAGQKWD